MKRIKLFIIAFLSLSAFVLNAKSSDPLEKEYQKSFTVNKDASLIIENKYGDIYLTAWDKDEIKIDVIVKIESYSRQSRAQDFFDGIDININGAKDYVKAVTHLPSFKSSGTMSFSIDYYVSLPATNKLDINQKYGSVILNHDWEGATEFDVAYGNVQLRDLTSMYNDIDVSYGELVAENISKADIRVAYSDLTIEDADKLDVKTSYSDLEFGFVNDMELKTGFDDIEIDGVVDLYARSSYTDIDIKKLENSLEIDLDYGDLDVDYVSAGFKLIEVDSNNAGVELGMDESASYTLDVLTRYGDFYMRNDDRIDREKLSHSSYRYKGKVGSASTSGKVIIDASYASIEIK